MDRCRVIHLVHGRMDRDRLRGAAGLGPRGQRRFERTTTGRAACGIVEADALGIGIGDIEGRAAFTAAHHGKWQARRHRAAHLAAETRRVDLRRRQRRARRYGIAGGVENLRHAVDRHAEAVARDVNARPILGRGPGCGDQRNHDRQNERQAREPYSYNRSSKLPSIAAIRKTPVRLGGLKFRRFSQNLRASLKTRGGFLPARAPPRSSGRSIA